MKHVAQYIDQTILNPEVTQKEIELFLDGVKKFRFIAAVINPCWVELARSLLPQDIKVCSVVAFPLGASSTQTKVYATKDLIHKGCDEIDMVLNIGKLKEKDYSYVRKEIEQVVDAAQGKVVKVIIETCLLNEEEKKTAACIIKEHGAQFVKTSTGFSRQGARIEDVKLLRHVVGPDFGVKASGGIRTFTEVKEFIEAGANRIGTSAGERIMAEHQRIRTPEY
ncbi:deoxyribose-phosphate aldolase [candidate division TA06 bacterium DG_78]|uniref:Deoxyribose-phosphate aldolase n=1 Tax=candidate division TA06 bacterium DG_78 TaxID=1703772 RepID=A0A0S7Y930_UNCT6|nr:MAG: deoxyribose-phosphate aldolase [candidate division TA06 bacterium DG_78]